MRVRIPPPLLAVAAAALMWWLDRRMPVLRLLVAPRNRIGWVFIGVGFGIDAASIAGFFRAKTTVNPIRIERAKGLVVLQIRAEEAALAAKFGDEYVEYTRRVRRWIGRVRQG